MMNQYNRIYETVDLDAIRHNMAAMQADLAKGTGIIGVVKADGYGHGAVPVAIAIDPYVCGYAVASPEEGIQLRLHGIEKPILVLGVSPQGSYGDLIRYDIRPTIFSYEKAKQLSEMALAAGKKALVHIAVDTGMGRIGYEVSEQSADEAAAISRLPGIAVEGMFTHFSKADETDQTFTLLQLERFNRFVDMLKDRGVTVPVLHCSNSAGILEYQQANFQAVRAGIAMYGLYPSDEVDKRHIELFPAMELKSFITYVKTVEPGTSISYGGTFTSDRKTRVATVPVGYADGYPRNVSNKADVLIRGRRARILGRVCMDQMMVDVTDIPEAAEGDLVTLIGRDGNDRILVEELAERGGGFHYEIICGISKRVPRVYLEGEKVVGCKDHYEDIYEGFGNK